MQRDWCIFVATKSSLDDEFQWMNPWVCFILYKWETADFTVMGSVELIPRDNRITLNWIIPVVPNVQISFVQHFFREFRFCIFAEPPVYFDLSLIFFLLVKWYDFDLFNPCRIEKLKWITIPTVKTAFQRMILLLNIIF